MVTITFKKSDFKGSTFFSVTDCPIFRALDRAGYNPISVGGYEWNGPDRKSHDFFNTFKKEVSDLIGMDFEKAAKTLPGKTFNVSR